MDNGKLKNYEEKLRSLMLELKEDIEESRQDRAPVKVDSYMGRVSRNDEMQVQQLAMEMGRRRELRMQRIDSALDRVKAGTYGICGRCRRPIADERLDAMPEVVLCVRCAEQPRRL